MPIGNNIKAEMKKAWRLIEKSQRIFLTTHEGTDGDDLGSLLAMRIKLMESGKKVSVAVHKGVPDYLKYLPGNLEVADYLDSADFDLVITFGCNQMSRTGLNALAKYAGPTINFDHHPDNKLFATVNIVEPSTSSVAELMFYFFETCNLGVGKDMATCLLTGIFTDTGGFRHANTTSDALSTASELMKKGARIDRISHMILGQKKPGSIKIWARALENTRFDEDRMMIYSVLTTEDMQETGATDDDLSGFINLLISIPQAKFAMLLRQDGDVVRGSLRSEPDRNTNVNKIAAIFGGGGHALASGFKVKGRLAKAGRGWKIHPV